LSEHAFLHAMIRIWGMSGCMDSCTGMDQNSACQTEEFTWDGA